MSSSAIKSKRSGFTLIELLVVIAIIAILAAILFPVFAKAREKARQTSCLSQTKQLGLGFIQYYQDYDEKLPAGSQNNTALAYLDKPGLGWAGQIYGEVKSASIYKCPDDSTAAVAATGNIPALVPVSYAFNSNAAGATQAIYNNVAKSILLFETVGNVADVTAPATSGQTTGAGDENSAAGDGEQGNTAATATKSTVGLNGGTVNAPAGTGISLYSTGLLAGSNATTTGTAAGSFATLTGRHTDGANYLLADGHSKWFRNSSVSAGLSNATANDCGPANTTFSPTSATAGADISANSGCPDGRLGGTFSVN